MNRYRAVAADGYEEVVRCDNEQAGFSAWIAIHNTNRGPALGGCRVWNYGSADEALEDVLRLSRAMTYKNSLAGLRLGGGKCVVKADLTRVDRAALFELIGEFVNTFEGRYITAEDVNSTIEDMAFVQRSTTHVATVGASGNPSPFTAYGVYCAIRAGVYFIKGRGELSGLRVAIQGVGETGGRLAQLLTADGCKVMVADINRASLDRLGRQVGFEEIDPEAVHRCACDIFSPCALGGTLNPDTIPELQCWLVAGSANNQLLNPDQGHLLDRLGIVYIPDYAANAGGVINISCEIDRDYDEAVAWSKTGRIGATVTEILRRSAATNTPTSVVADTMAEELFRLEVLAC
jgi:leucine dehydrogenase